MELGKMLAIPHHKKPTCYKMMHRALDLQDSEHSNEPSSCIKVGDFDWMSDY
jgi:hypothetical protein